MTKKSARQLLEEFGSDAYSQGTRFGIDPKFNFLTLEGLKKSIKENRVIIPALVGKDRKKAQYKKLPKKDIADFIKGFISGRK